MQPLFQQAVVNQCNNTLEHQVNITHVLPAHGPAVEVTPRVHSGITIVFHNSIPIVCFSMIAALQNIQELYTALSVVDKVIIVDACSVYCVLIASNTTSRCCFRITECPSWNIKNHAIVHVSFHPIQHQLTLFSSLGTVWVGPLSWPQAFGNLEPTAVAQ